MSTFGGDSWVPEAQYRKRRVDELLSEEIPDDEACRMSNGRFACLVCPQRPVLDTLPVLHVHRRGARHRAAAENQLLKKQKHHDEIQKRIALGKVVGPTSSVIERKNASLFIATKESKSKILGHTFLSNNQIPSQEERPTSISPAAPRSKPQMRGTPVIARSPEAVIGPSSPREHLVSSVHIQQAWEEERKRGQQELRSFESGWKRDGNGGWYRDENVEFDSDEEPPDILP